MGISYHDFWSMNPHIINIIANGYQEKMKMQDSQMWFMGMYIHSAVSVAVEHNLYGKKSKQKYFEKPIFKEIEEQNKPFTEDDLQKQRELFVAKLQLMKANFDLNKENEVKINHKDE